MVNFKEGYYGYSLTPVCRGSRQNKKVITVNK